MKAGFLAARTVQTKVQMWSTRITQWSMLEEKMNWGEALGRYLGSMSPLLVSWSATASIVGIDKKFVSAFALVQDQSVVSLASYHSKIIDNLSRFSYREWPLLPSLQSIMPSNRTSNSLPLPSKNGICHRDFRIDDAEAQRCHHRLILCRILHPTNSSAPQFVTRM